MRELRELIGATFAMPRAASYAADVARLRYARA